MIKQNGPVLGATLYSFTNEWQQRLFTLDEMVAKVAESGLGPAVVIRVSDTGPGAITAAICALSSPCPSTTFAHRLGTLEGAGHIRPGQNFPGGYFLSPLARPPKPPFVLCGRIISTFS